MLLNIAIAAILMLATTAVHTGGMLLALHLIRKEKAGLMFWWRRSHIYQVGIIVLLMFYASVIEVLLWAGTYLALNAIEGYEKAVYFSMVTFTTLGYGEIVLEERWRLLSSFEAANGIIMFGWTTAIVLAAVQHIYLQKKGVDP